MIPRTLLTNTTGCRCWMLVDDNQEILRLLEDAVAKIFGVEVAGYDSPVAALAAFQTAPERFQCVITDLEMPGMSGFELCDQIHEISPRIRVLLATGSQHVTAQEAGARGFCGLLTKPFSLSALQREMALLPEGE